VQRSNPSAGEAAESLPASELVEAVVQHSEMSRTSVDVQLARSGAGAAVRHGHLPPDPVYCNAYYAYVLQANLDPCTEFSSRSAVVHVQVVSCRLRGIPSCTE